jgi:hypothetical protein
MIIARDKQHTQMTTLRQQFPYNHARISHFILLVVDNPQFVLVPLQSNDRE